MNKECPEGRFGPGCTGVCHCLYAAACNNITGFCSTRCQLGWTGADCQIGIELRISGWASLVGALGIICCCLLCVFMGIVFYTARRRSWTATRNLQGQQEGVQEVNGNMLTVIEGQLVQAFHIHPAGGSTDNTDIEDSSDRPVQPPAGEQYAQSGPSQQFEGGTGEGSTEQPNRAPTGTRTNSKKDKRSRHERNKKRLKKVDQYTLVGLYQSEESESGQATLEN